MTIMVRSVLVAVFLLFGFLPAIAQSPAPPSWVQGLHSRVRLISGGLEGGQGLVGIEIALDPGFKTYWRTPGDSGIPPSFDWSGSDNVAAAEVRWPAPTRHEDAAGVSYVYGGAVVLPVLVRLKEPGKPVRLSLSMNYGICNDICIPAQAELTAELSQDGPHRSVIEAALAAVPRPQPLGAKEEPAVVEVERLTPQDKPSFAVTVRVPEGARPTLFAEGPENWYFSTSQADAGNRFTLTVEDMPKTVSGPVPVRLTLVAGDNAVETEVNLDAGRQPR
ncbi:MAG TPA: protein-disulfide reductase DsbD domain-containing protein [Microvirga sp.]|nr:protein-disulfide reductase DsbD domain-containing protein [Microvirga sp.]